MNELNAILFVMTLFVLRFGVPLLLMFVFAWLLNRVQEHWQVASPKS